MTKKFTFLFIIIIIIPVVHVIHVNEINQLQEVVPIDQLTIVNPHLNLTQVYILYSNVFITQRTEMSSYVAVTHVGSFKQTAFTVLSSPWKPQQIASDNTNQPFTPLNYDPTTMSTNPIAETENQYAWSYDHLNHVLFIKFLLTSPTTTSIYYVMPIITNFVSTKTTYATNENIVITQDIYGNYSAQALINWMIKLTILDSLNKQIITIDRGISLQNNQTIKLQYSMQPLSPGNYTAKAEIIDQGNDSLSTHELNFNVTAATTITTWIIGVPVIITLTILTTIYFYKMKRPTNKSKKSS